MRAGPAPRCRRLALLLLRDLGFKALCCLAWLLCVSALLHCTLLALGKSGVAFDSSPG